LKRPHWAGTIANKSLLARQVSKVSADWLHTAQPRAKKALISSLTSAVIEVEPSPGRRVRAERLPWPTDGQRGTARSGGSGTAPPDPNSAMGWAPSSAPI
jgi:hypothetical protein